MKNFGPKKIKSMTLKLIPTLTILMTFATLTTFSSCGEEDPAAIIVVEIYMEATPTPSPSPSAAPCPEGHIKNCK